MGRIKWKYVILYCNVVLEIDFKMLVKKGFDFFILYVRNVKEF